MVGIGIFTQTKVIVNAYTINIADKLDLLFNNNNSYNVTIKYYLTNKSNINFNINICKES